jgi:hypothetical protein
MTGRVARRRNDHNGTVAEHIAVALEQGHRVIGIEARRAVGARPFVFGLLNIEHDLREQLDIADMVGMGMRDRHRLDVGGLDAAAHSTAMEERNGAAASYQLPQVLWCFIRTITIRFHVFAELQRHAAVCRHGRAAHLLARLLRVLDHCANARPALAAPGNGLRRAVDTLFRMTSTATEDVDRFVVGHVQTRRWRRAAPACLLRANRGRTARIECEVLRSQAVRIKNAITPNGKRESVSFRIFQRLRGGLDGTSGRPGLRHHGVDLEQDFLRVGRVAHFLALAHVQAGEVLDIRIPVRITGAALAVDDHDVAPIDQPLQSTPERSLVGRLQRVAFLTAMAYEEACGRPRTAA